MPTDEVLIHDCDLKKNGANVHFVNSVIGRYRYAFERKDFEYAEYAKACEESLSRFLASGKLFHPDYIQRAAKDKQ